MPRLSDFRSIRNDFRRAVSDGVDRHIRFIDALQRFHRRLLPSSYGAERQSRHDRLMQFWESLFGEDIVICDMSSFVVPSSMALTTSSDLWVTPHYRHTSCGHCGTMSNVSDMWISGGSLVCCDGVDYEEEDDSSAGYHINDSDSRDPLRRKIAFSVGPSEKRRQPKRLSGRKSRIGVSNGGHLWLGVELEVQSVDSVGDAISFARDTVGEFAALKEDGSLESDGFEIASAPGTLAWHKSVWGPFLEDARTYLKGHRAGVGYGLHVHVDRESLGILGCGRLMAFIHNKENYDFLTKIARRGSTQYVYYVGDTGVSTIKHGHRTHYDAAGPSSQYKTIEIRIFRSTVSAASFYRTLEFVDALCRWCLFGAGVTKDALHFRRFLEWFAHPSVRKDYPELETWVARHYPDIGIKKGRKEAPSELEPA